jgi:phosphoribosylformimino-5-aminoimidazole carboxamide ribotide isomerase
MTQFRPCIDLHDGAVKQIVGGTLRDSGSGPKENFVSQQPASWFADRYRRDALTGGHVIKLGAGNDQAALEALSAYPGGLQLGGGVNAENACDWIDAGASHVIVTSWLFEAEGQFSWDRLRELVARVGKKRLVIDLSCRRVASDGGEPAWRVAMNRWQTLTEVPVTVQWLDSLSEYADEFLIHAADVEGLCQGIDEELADRIGRWGKIPVTYAGGVSSMADLVRIQDASGGNLDVTVGSALDLFGGEKISYQELLKWNRGDSNG